MESKHKNALIVALLAVVLVMAVGYAAFAQSLTINSTATIQESTDGKQNWKVAFEKNEDAKVERPGATGSTPTGSISFTDDYLAVIDAQFDAPGDNIVYTFTVKNDGSIKATLTQPTISLTTTPGTDTDPSNTGVKFNQMTFTVSSLGQTKLAPGESTTFTVTATLDQSADLSGVNQEAGNNSASINVNFTANQSA